MKLASIFFKASASILEIYLKDTNKQARKDEVSSIFFKPHKPKHLRGLPQRLGKIRRKDSINLIIIST
jgi:hypothetical protein